MFINDGVCLGIIRSDLDEAYEDIDVHFMVD